ncbi:MAG: Hint domain-containing protein [Sedimentitalea sp.]
MATYIVTTTNWNDPSFWSAISEAGPGHTLDFSALPSTYSVDFWPDNDQIIIDDGATTYVIGDSDDPGAQNIKMGNPTQLEYFTTVIGTQGDDTVGSGSSDSTIQGGDGNDTLIGNDGKDNLEGGDGNDELYGGRGDDQLSGGAGDDILQGEEGKDIIDGGAGSDTINVSELAEKDAIDGGESAGDKDELRFVSSESVAVSFTDLETGSYEFAGPGGASGTFTNIEHFEGGSGDDTLDFSALAGKVTVTYTGDGEGSISDGVDTISFAGIENLILTDGNDSVVGGANNDDHYIDLGDGNDKLWGGMGNDTVLGGEGNDNITTSHGDDQISGGAGDDTLNGDYGSDTLEGGTGNDTLWGGFDDDKLLGETGDDYLYGGYGDDVLFGGVGNDTLDGGRNDDTVDGGDDADLFTFTSGMGNATVIGGEGGNDDDTLDLSGQAGSFTVTYTGDEAGTITDGTDSITFSQIENLILSDQADVVDATADSVGINLDAGGGNDKIDGGTGNDTIFAGDGVDSVDGDLGDDRIYGGADDDTILGGTGNDTLHGGDPLADSTLIHMTFQDGGTGIATDQSGNGHDGTYENGANDNGTGWQDPSEDSARFDGVDDYIEIPNDPSFELDEGTVSLRVNADASTSGFLFSRDSNNFDGGGHIGLKLNSNGSLELRIQSDSSSHTITSASGLVAPGDWHHVAVTFGSEGTYIYLDGVEVASGSYTGGIAGNSEPWTLGANQQKSDDGVANKLQDHFDGSLGEFALIGSQLAPEDVERLNSEGMPDAIDSGSDTLEGGAGADSLSGGDGGDSLLGGAGEDTIEGGSGDDTIYGGDDSDQLEGGAGNDTLYGEAGNDALLGGQGDDKLDGGTGNDRLSGGDGDDYIQSSNIDSGNDTIIGGDGNDTVYTGSGDDTVDGGEGNDTIYLSGGANSASGGDGDDLITNSGASGASDIDGGAGNDTLSTYDGAGNDDTIDGGDGRDSIVSNDGDDRVDGGDGADTIQSGSGDDTITGGSGDDSLTGGAGDDVFVYAAGDGDDTITDFNFGNTGTLNDGDSTNNDFIDLNGFYDHIFQLRADQADDGVLNQSNQGDNGVDYSDNDAFGSGSITMSGANAASFTAENTGVTCFTAGTAIRTPQGETLIEQLTIGDLVQTADNGPQPIRWIGTQTLGPDALRAQSKLNPVLFKANVVGNTRPLLVSQQHGLMLGDVGLVRAKHLAAIMPGVRIARGVRSLTYVHLMFDAHQIIFAQGTPTESFYPGPMSLRTLTCQSCVELFSVFPQLRTPVAQRPWTVRHYGETARPFLAKQHLTRKLIPHT